MKKLVLLLAATLFVSTQAVAQDNPVVGVINLEQALFNSDAAQSLEQNTRSEFQSDEQRLERLNTELREIIERAQRDESILSEQELRELNADAEEKQVQMPSVCKTPGTSVSSSLLKLIASYWARPLKPWSKRASTIWYSMLRRWLTSITATTSLRW